jgi:hypothetical protein
LFQTFPFFGVLPVLLDENGKEIHGPGEGYLVFRRPWPGIMRTLFGNHERFETTYFKKFPGYYCTGDGKGDESSAPISDGMYITLHNNTVQTESIDFCRFFTQIFVVK